MKTWAWATVALIVAVGATGMTGCGSSNPGAGGAGGSGGGTTSSNSPTVTQGPTGGTTTASICGQPDTSAAPDAVCDKCFSKSCCDAWNALLGDQNATGYFTCMLGSDGTGQTSGCFFTNPPGTDAAGFHTCSEGCATTAGTAAVAELDAVYNCAANCDTQADQTCSQGFQNPTPNACATDVTFPDIVCDTCLSDAAAGCCTEFNAAAPFFDSSGNPTQNATDFDTCLGDSTSASCTTPGGTAATCAVAKCKTECGF